MTTFAEGHQIGPYRIVRLLGEGGMGAVYEARQESLDRRVALKTLHPEYARNQDAVARFFNEAKILSKLEHPSIVQASDFGHAADGAAYLVMEYLRGESLRRRLAKLRDHGERLPTTVVMQIAWQVADVLGVAHAQGVVHRDLKPDNLMLVADPIAPGGERVKVLDFGIAKLTQGAGKGALQTDTQAVMGTPLYMSPEQCAGAGGVDAKADVYSLGCVLYEALAGQPPFTAEGAGQIIGMHLYQTPPPLTRLVPKLPASVTDLIHRMLTKDKSQRPGMSQVADEIGVLLSKLPGGGSVVRSRATSTTDPDATRAIPAIRAASTLGASIGQVGPVAARRRRLIAGSLTGVLLIVLLIGLYLRGGDKRSVPARQSQTAMQPSIPAIASPPPANPKPQSKEVATEATAPAKPPVVVTKPIAPSAPLHTKSTEVARTERPETRSPPIQKPKPTKPKAFGYED